LRVSPSDTAPVCPRDPLLPLGGCKSGGSRYAPPVRGSSAGLRRRGDIWFLRKVIDGHPYERSTGFSDLKAARRRAAEIEVELRAGSSAGQQTARALPAGRKTYAHTHAPSKRPRTQVRDRHLRPRLATFRDQ
jgi:hypothetical protein